MELDLEEIWQAVHCRFRDRRNLKDRALWVLYSSLHRLVRVVLMAAARG
jgi:hypothetical protein